MTSTYVISIIINKFRYEQEFDSILLLKINKYKKYIIIMIFYFLI